MKVSFRLGFSSNASDIRMYVLVLCDVEVDLIGIVNPWSWWSWWFWHSIVVVCAVRLPDSPEFDFNLAGFSRAFLSGRRSLLPVKPYGTTFTSDEHVHITRSFQLFFIFLRLSVDEKRCQQADQ